MFKEPTEQQEKVQRETEEEEWRHLPLFCQSHFKTRPFSQGREHSHFCCSGDTSRVGKGWTHQFFPQSFVLHWWMCALVLMEGSSQSPQADLPAHPKGLLIKAQSLSSPSAWRRFPPGGERYICILFTKSQKLRFVCNLSAGKKKKKRN